MKTAIAIHRLCEKPEWMTQCQTWDETEWPRTPEIMEFFADHYRDATNNHGNVLPQTFIALAGDQLVGMLSLIAEDHPDFLHLGPWVASGYVVEKMRNKGIAYLLGQTALVFARDRLKEKYIYVYTHLDVTTKGCEFMQETYDPFDPQRNIGLYSYNLELSRDFAQTRTDVVD